MYLSIFKSEDKYILGLFFEIIQEVLLHLKHTFTFLKYINFPLINKLIQTDSEILIYKPITKLKCGLADKFVKWINPPSICLSSIIFSCILLIIRIKKCLCLKYWYTQTCIRILIRTQTLLRIKRDFPFVCKWCRSR